MFKLSAFILASSVTPVWAVSEAPEAPAPYLTNSRSVARNARVPFA